MFTAITIENMMSKTSSTLILIYLNSSQPLAKVIKSGDEGKTDY